MGEHDSKDPSSSNVARGRQALILDSSRKKKARGSSLNLSDSADAQWGTTPVRRLRGSGRSCALSPGDGVLGVRRQAILCGASDR